MKNKFTPIFDEEYQPKLKEKNPDRQKIQNKIKRFLRGIFN